MTDAEALFVDTNVLVYANVAEAPQHEQALAAIARAYDQGKTLWISRQVIREFVAVLSRPQAFAQPSTPEVIIERARYFQERFEVADDSFTVTKCLLQLVAEISVGGKNIHDANIVATMMAYVLQGEARFVFLKYIDLRFPEASHIRINSPCPQHSTTCKQTSKTARQPSPSSASATSACRSQSKAAELLDMSRARFLEELSRRSVPAVQVQAGELSQELEWLKD